MELGQAMARRSKSEVVDLAQAHELTAGLIDALTCPDGKTQAFLRDTKAPALRVRVTAGAAKSYVFERKLNRQTVRKTIGDVRDWTLAGARAEASRLGVMLDSGTDPREVERQKMADAAARKAQADAEAQEALTQALTVAGRVAALHGRRQTQAQGRMEAPVSRRPDEGCCRWRRAAEARQGLDQARASGRPDAAVTDKHRPRHYPRLVQQRSEARPGSGRPCRCHVSGFLSWCATRKEYRALVNKEAARASDLGDVLPASKQRTDALEAEQLAAWFAGTDKLRNRHAAAYLQALVLTGARREEMAALRWADIDFQNQRMTIADKVDATRLVPLTPYLAWLLDALPYGVLGDGTRNPFVFASEVTKNGENKGRTRSASGRISEPRAYHADVLTDAALPHVSIHGLRRTFALMGEAAGAPAGAIAQVMGHKPSAIAERYKPRPIGVLGEYLAKVEAFILAKAGIQFDAQAAKAKGLRLGTAA